MGAEDDFFEAVLKLDVGESRIMQTKDTIESASVISNSNLEIKCLSVTRWVTWQRVAEKMKIRKMVSSEKVRIIAKTIDSVLNVEGRL